MPEIVHKLSFTAIVEPYRPENGRDLGSVIVNVFKDGDKRTARIDVDLAEKEPNGATVRRSFHLPCRPCHPRICDEWKGSDAAEVVCQVAGDWQTIEVYFKAPGVPEARLTVDLVQEDPDDQICYVHARHVGAWWIQGLVAKDTEHEVRHV